MIPSASLRGRTLEDLGELEEKGLLRRNPSGEALDSGTRRRDKGKEKEKGGNGWLEVRRDGEEDTGEGLTSTRDKQAFALLVLLCELRFYFPLARI